MYWYICLGVSVATFIAAIICAIVLSNLRYKRKRIGTPNRVLILGIFISATILFCPVYLEKFADSVSWVEWVKSVLLSMQHAVRLFAFEGDYLEFWTAETFEKLPSALQSFYTGTSSVFYTVAPLLTFSFILSFFKNAAAHRKYVFSFLKHAHVFSELNEKSLALAKSIDEKYNKKGKRYKFWRKALIVFTDVIRKDDEEIIELIEEAKEMGAILFTKDLESIKYRKRLSVRKVTFYLISEDEEEKIRHAESIMKDYDVKGAKLYVFSDDIRSELLMAAKKIDNMTAIRVNDIQSLIYHNLDVHGLRLFENARSGGGESKTISAVIVGLGRYGIEMLKALTWFCQVDGYNIKINAFDVDEHARERFADMCPELMSDEFNGQDIPGMARYDIRIHGGVDTRSPEFSKKISEITDATYIFVCLGSDEENLSTAVKIRTLSERVHYTGDHHKPDIETVIYDSEVKNTMSVDWTVADDTEKVDADGKKKLNGVANFKGQEYNIHMIGDLENFYCVDTIINSELIDAGVMVHLSYSDITAEDFSKYQNYKHSIFKIIYDRLREKFNPKGEFAKRKELFEKIKNSLAEFWKYEYNYNSSITRALYIRMCEKRKVKITVTEEEWEALDEKEKKNFAEIEHKRWIAYMRTIGYQYSGSKNIESKNFLGRLHHNLVSVADLVADVKKPEEKEKFLRKTAGVPDKKAEDSSQN